MPIKRLVKTGRSQLKSPVSLKRLEEEDGWGRRVWMILMPNVDTVHVCSLKTTTVRMGSMPKMSKVGTH